MSTSRDYKNVIDHILYEAKRHGWDTDFDRKVTIIPIDSICYVGDCVVCHEGTMIAAGETSGICDSCAPHICRQELPTDFWCDICGRDLPYEETEEDRRFHARQLALQAQIMEDIESGTYMSWTTLTLHGGIK